MEGIRVNSDNSEVLSRKKEACPLRFGSELLNVIKEYFEDFFTSYDQQFADKVVWNFQVA